MEFEDAFDEPWMHDPETLARLEEIDRIYEGVDK